ncbi:alpha/beta hydrolase [Lacisediminihabitans sp.]|jgi:dienelactone hydrolase|uniref:alpha/beta hydrolase n=1 Tax=Lacisediminihabitans sp. TaxID=2787631 RepID=UPI002F92E22E
MTDVHFARENVDAVPVIHVSPSVENDRHQLALFLPYLGGTKEAVAPQLARLAERGFTAVSFDPWRLGERGDGDDRAVMEQVFSHFRRDMWPILGQSTLDAVHVLDWATERFDVAADNIVAGGLSMGGDISVALAGIDKRVTRVAAVVATPDWTRPGMTRVGEPRNIIDQGQPTAYGAWLYNELDPSTHQDRYAHGPAIAFDLGADDTHVPPASAFAFHEALKASAPVAAERMRITAHAGLDHLGAVRDDTVLTAAIDWMTARASRSRA